MGSCLQFGWWGGAEAGWGEAGQAEIRPKWLQQNAQESEVGCEVPEEGRKQTDRAKKF